MFQSRPVWYRYPRSYENVQASKRISFNKKYCLTLKGNPKSRLGGAVLLEYSANCGISLVKIWAD